MSDGMDVGAVLSNLGADPFNIGGFQLGDPMYPQTTGDPFGVGRVTADISSESPGKSGGWDLAGLAKEALPFVRLGLGGLTAYTGVEAARQAREQTGLLRQAEHRTSAAAAPGITAAEQLMPAGTKALLGGPLPPELESQVEQWKADQRARARDFFARAGITDSTMQAQVEAWIEAEAQNLRAQLAQGLLGAGGAAEATAIGGESRVAQAAGTQAGTVAQAMQNATQAVNALLGGQA